MVKNLQNCGISTPAGRIKRPVQCIVLCSEYSITYVEPLKQVYRRSAPDRKRQSATIGFFIKAPLRNIWPNRISRLCIGSEYVGYRAIQPLLYWTGKDVTIRNCHKHAYPTIDISA